MTKKNKKTTTVNIKVVLDHKLVKLYSTFSNNVYKVVTKLAAVQLCFG